MPIRLAGTLAPAHGCGEPRPRPSAGRRACRTASLGRALPADRLAAAGFGELAPVVHKEAASTSELVSLPRYHPEGQLLIREVRTGQLKRLGYVVRVKIDRS